MSRTCRSLSGVLSSILSSSSLRVRANCPRLSRPAFHPAMYAVSWRSSAYTANVNRQYLLRIEQIGLHVAGAPQYYISCAQITVTGGGGGNPPKVSIPGYVSRNGELRSAMLHKIDLPVLCQTLASPLTYIIPFLLLTP